MSCVHCSKGKTDNYGDESFETFEGCKLAESSVYFPSPYIKMRNKRYFLYTERCVFDDETCEHNGLIGNCGNSCKCYLLGKRPIESEVDDNDI